MCSDRVPSLKFQMSCLFLLTLLHPRVQIWPPHSNSFLACYIYSLLQEFLCEAEVCVEAAILELLGCDIKKAWFALFAKSSRKSTFCTFYLQLILVFIGSRGILHDNRTETYYKMGLKKKLVFYHFPGTCFIV